MKEVFVYVLRRDLRVADNPVFRTLSSLSGSKDAYLIPLYVFNPTQYELSGLVKEGQTSPYPEARSRLGSFWRCGPHRIKFLAESLHDIQHSLRQKGSDLIIRAGRTDEVVSNLLQVLTKEGMAVKGVWLTKDFATEEQAEERAIRAALPKDVKMNIISDDSTLIRR